eukprot:7319751-Alexandrium_andersonii.AAC.1
MSGKQDLLPYDSVDDVHDCKAKNEEALARSAELSRGPLCAIVRTEREHGNKNIPRASGP